MSNKQYAALIGLINEATPKVRADLDDTAWELVLIDQNEEMTRRLQANEPLDVRRGLGRGVVVFSIFEVLLSALRESGTDTTLLVGDKQELVLTAQPIQLGTTAIANSIEAPATEDPIEDPGLEDDGLNDDIDDWGDLEPVAGKKTITSERGQTTDLDESAPSAVAPATAGNE